MVKEWDRANMKSLGANVKRETAEAFQAYAKENGTTVGALLRGFIEATVAGTQATAAEMHAVGTQTKSGVLHLVSYKNTDLLKAETAHHNPGSLNPDGMLNYILDEYFRFVKSVRR